MMADSGPKVARHKKGRSRVSNGSEILAGVDGRSVWARRFRDLLAAHVEDLGGPDMVSEAERSLLRRASALEVELERLEARFAAAGDGGPDVADLDLYQRTTNTLRRLLDTVGLERRSRDVTPDALSYAKGG